MAAALRTEQAKYVSLINVAACRDAWQGTDQDGDRCLGKAAWIPAFMVITLE